MPLSLTAMLMSATSADRFFHCAITIRALFVADQEQIITRPYLLFLGPIAV